MFHLVPLSRAASRQRAGRIAMTPLQMPFHQPEPVQTAALAPLAPRSKVSVLQCMLRVLRVIVMFPMGPFQTLLTRRVEVGTVAGPSTPLEWKSRDAIPDAADPLAKLFDPPGSVKVTQPSTRKNGRAQSTVPSPSPPPPPKPSTSPPPMTATASRLPANIEVVNAQESRPWFAWWRVGSDDVDAAAKLRSAHQTKSSSSSSPMTATASRLPANIEVVNTQESRPWFAWWRVGSDDVDAPAKLRSAHPASDKRVMKRMKLSVSNPPPVPKAAPPSPPPPPPRRVGAWAPTREQQAARRTMILSLVKRDSERLIDQLIGALPWATDKDLKLKQSLRELERRSPLLQWHVNNNVLPADMTSLMPPTQLPTLPPLIEPPTSGGLWLPRSRAPFTVDGLPKPAEKPVHTRGRLSPPAEAARRPTRPRAAQVGSIPIKAAKRAAPAADADADAIGEGGGAKGPKLKAALLEVSPVFFTLVSDAAAAQPGRSVGLYRRVGTALVVLGWWNLGRSWGAGPQRQYPLMNDFLGRIVALVAECEGILACDGESGCVIEAVEAHKRELDREVQRASTRPSLTQSRTSRGRAAVTQTNGK